MSDGHASNVGGVEVAPPAEASSPQPLTVFVRKFYEEGQLWLESDHRYTRRSMVRHKASNLSRVRITTQAWYIPVVAII